MRLVPIFQAAISQNMFRAREQTFASFKPIRWIIPSSSESAGLADVNPLEEAKDIQTMVRSIAARAAAILESVPHSARVRNDWGQDSFEVTLKVDPNRANLAGVTNQDVAQSSQLGNERKWD